MLASSESGARVWKTKASRSPVAMPSLRKQGGGVMDGLCPAVSRSDPHSTGFLAVESTPAFGKALPFAGRCRNEGLGRFMRTVGLSSPPFKDSTTKKGCSSGSNEEGNLHPTSSCGSRRLEGGSFARGYSARAVQRCRSTAIAASGGRIEASPASGVAIGRQFSGLRFAACLQRRTTCFEGAVTARRCRVTPSTGGGRPALTSAAKREQRARGHCESGTLERQRGSDARERVRASEVQLQKSSSGSLTQRSARWRLA
jgi:hypothetical protein